MQRNRTISDNGPAVLLLLVVVLIVHLLELLGVIGG